MLILFTLARLSFFDQVLAFSLSLIFTLGVKSASPGSPLAALPPPPLVIQPTQHHGTHFLLLLLIRFNAISFYLLLFHFDSCN